MQVKEQEPVVAEPRPGRRILWIVISLALIAALVFVKMRYFPSPTAGGKGGGKGAGARGKGGSGGANAKIPVTVYLVQPTRLADVVASTGSVIADESVVIQSEIAGKITSLNFKEGQPVRKGQLLFTINAADVQAQLRKQQYNIKLYQDQEKRERTLLEKEYISRQEYEQSNNALLTAQADLQALRVTLDKANVRAPFDGVLGLRSVSVGAYVSPGTSIVTLSRIRPVKIDFSVPSRYAQSVHVGDPITITNEATIKQYKAKVYALNPQIDPVSRTLSMRAVYPNSGNELRPGAFVRVALELGQNEEALQVPTESVTPNASGYTVFLVRNGKVKEQPIKIGIRSDKYIQITNGLAVGDTIVRTGILQVKEGSPVTIQK